MSLSDAENTFKGALIAAADDALGPFVEQVRAEQQAALTQAQADVAALTTEVDALTAQGERDRQTIAADAETVKALNAQLTSATASLTQAQADLAKANARIKELEEGDPEPPPFLVVGSSKGSVTLDGVDKALGKKAPLVRVFEQAPPAKWSQTSDLPSDNRPVLVSIVGDPDDVAAGKMDAQIKAWLGDAPKGTMVAIDHEGDAKVRKGQYKQAQWVAAQEHFLPLVAELGFTPVAITTYQSTLDGTIGSYWSPKMRAVPGVVVGIDTYTPGTPSATVPKMVKNIADFADSIGRPWVVPEIGIGVANGSDAERGKQLAAILTWCASQPNCKGLCYWPNGNFVPGPATWAALAADYPIGA